MQITFDATRAPEGITDIAVPSVILDWALCGAPLDIIARNSKRFAGRFEPAEEGVVDSQPVAVVGYGPSLRDTWEELANYRVIFTCSGAHHYLLIRGITPTFHGESDPQVHKALMLGDLNPSVTYLPASICHPSYMDRLEDAGVKVLLWHPFLMDLDMYRQVPHGDWVIPGSTIIGPRLMRLARLLGYNNLHMYGIDGSGGHAEKHPNPKLYSKHRPVRYNGIEFIVNEHLLVHIGAMFNEMNQFPKDTQFAFHGDGLIQEMAKTWTWRESSLYHPLAMVKDD